MSEHDHGHGGGHGHGHGRDRHGDPEDFDHYPVGPPPDHRVSRAAFLSAAAAAGLEVVREETFLPCQDFVLLRPRA